jgi:hypothetical protein
VIEQTTESHKFTRSSVEHAPLFKQAAFSLPSVVCFIGFLGSGPSSHPGLGVGIAVLAAVTFVGLPFLVHTALRSKSLLVYPLFLIYVILGLAMGVAGGPGNPNSDLYLATITFMGLLAAGCGAALFHRDLARTILRDSTAPRQSARHKVDAIVRIIFRNDGSEPFKPKATDEPQNVCVVIRNVSQGGLGLYGFPDDINRLAKALSSTAHVKIEVIYRDKSHPLSVACRWWKGDLQKGECGLVFAGGTQSETFVQAILEDAGSTVHESLISRWFNPLGSSAFVLALWTFSVVGLLSVNP